MHLAVSHIAKTSYGKSRPGFALITVITLLACISAILALSFLQCKAVYELTRSLDASNQQYYLEESLKSITQEAFLSYSEASTAADAPSFSEILNGFVRDLNGLIAPSSQIQSISVAQLPQIVLRWDLLHNTQKGLNFKDTSQSQQYGFILGQYLQAGPYAKLGEHTVQYVIDYKNGLKSSVTIVTHQFAIPISNIAAIEYIADRSLDSASPTPRALSVNDSELLLKLPLPTAIAPQENQLPYHARYLVSACKHFFDPLWSERFRDNLLRQAYSDGYFSEESWCFKQFDGFSFDETERHLTIDLNAFKGNQIAIVDKQGGLKVSIKGAQSISKALPLCIYSYAQAPTVVNFEAAPSQPFIAYLSRCCIQASAFTGCLFLSPESWVDSSKLTISGSLYYAQGSQALDRCAWVSVSSNTQLKSLLQPEAPHLVLTHSSIAE